MHCFAGAMCYYTNLVASVATGPQNPLLLLSPVAYADATHRSAHWHSTQ